MHYGHTTGGPILSAREAEVHTTTASAQCVLSRLVYGPSLLTLRSQTVLCAALLGAIIVNFVLRFAEPDL